MFCEVLLNCGSWKPGKFFNMKIRKQSAQPLCFMNESQLNPQEHEHCSGTDVAFHSTHWKVYQSKLSVVLDDVNVISDACFSLMT